MVNVALLVVGEIPISTLGSRSSGIPPKFGRERGLGLLLDLHIKVGDGCRCGFHIVVNLELADQEFIVVVAAFHTEADSLDNIALGEAADDNFLLLPCIAFYIAISSLHP